MLLPASRLMVPFWVSSEPVPEKEIVPTPETTVSASEKLRPACNVTDQPSPPTMLAPLPIVMLLPASNLSRLPGALMPVLAAKSHGVPAEIVMLFNACKVIWENPTNAEFTFKLSVPATGASPDPTVPEPALPL